MMTKTEIEEVLKAEYTFEPFEFDLSCFSDECRQAIKEGRAMLVPLTCDKCAVVDTEDAWVNARPWYAAKKGHGNFYAETNRYDRITGKSTPITLHRLLMRARPGEQVDHRNRVTLDNRRCNLRICTAAENARNAVKMVSASGFIGVTWHKLRAKWRAHIEVGGHHVHLGLFTDPVSAAKARDAAAIEMHGEFASLNFPSGL